ncbi:MAG TPA: hypothetical protein VGY56_00180, partial [Verrucomicrobiae bacterium]|nr:hypothetical protein [Verrucomicrobiae bacterium]
NIVSIAYFETSLLTVKTLGKGNIGPNYNGQKLRLGQKYTMSATAASGFVFTNWTSATNGAYTVYTNAATVQFTMLTNLVMQANFRDAFNPYLAITNVTSGMLWTNPTFTVMGVATDDEAVASINYSLNGAPYAAATTNGIEWSAGPLALTLGTNVFSAYALATNGNLSVTDTVRLVYAVSNLLTVATNGRGVFSPDYNGQSLRIGENYSMTATAGSGFVFTNWSSGPVGGPLTAYTNKAAAIFEMTPNLEMQANFRDTIAPYLKVTNATQGMVLWTNSSFTVMGVATDDEEVAFVTWSLNGAATTLPVNNNIAAWQAPLSLAEGTNVFKVYARSTNGNLSVTDTVDLVYAVSNVMVVATNGPGTFAPNYNNQLLRAGENYSITATPAAHFILTNWSAGLVGGPLSIYTNKPTALFEMQSNLVMQANFHDALAPYLRVTNATQGMVLWTNASFTVMGVATDDQEVATVTYSLNGAATTLPIFNDIGTWQAPLSLAEGTNIFRIYAQATNGNYSVTNTVDLVYAVSNVLVVATNGPGTIAPNYNNQNLRVGENYSMTATPAAHFILTNWSAGLAGGALWIYTNKSTALFEMQSNLVMQANFHDALAPYLRVTNATQGMLWTNPTFTVMGVATDDQAVASVNFSLNGSAYAPATTNGIQWNTGPLTLMAGTNIFAVYAQATNGNVSATNTLALVCVVTNQLLIQSYGIGTLSPNYSNAWLRVGQNYSITALPAAGFVATNWVISTNFIGGATTNKSTVHFMMASNLTLQVNFSETAKPALTVVSPASGTREPGVATVTGAARDVWGVATVAYELNNGPWTNVVTTNGFTNWITVVALNAGTNILKAFAMNLGGNYSPTNTLSIISTNPAAVEFGLTSPTQTGHGFNFNIKLSPGLSGRIEVSTNLIDWDLLTNFTETNGTVNIDDPNATAPQRFYRAVVP